MLDYTLSGSISISLILNSLLLLPMVGIEPGLPTNQVIALSITPVHLSTASLIGIVYFFRVLSTVYAAFLQHSMFQLIRINVRKSGVPDKIRTRGCWLRKANATTNFLNFLLSLRQQKPEGIEFFVSALKF